MRQDRLATGPVPDQSDSGRDRRTMENRSSSFTCWISPKRFSALRKDIPSVTAQMLTLQLRQLEADGIVAATIHAEVPVRVEYTLTTYGRTLSTLLRGMRNGVNNI